MILIIGTAGWIIWSVIPHNYDPGNNTSRADVTKFLSVPPPPEAHDFHVAAFRYAVATSVFIRFAAPTDVCQHYARTIVPNMPLTTLDYNEKYEDLMTLSASSKRLPDLRWFDLPYAANCWLVQSGKPVFQQPPENVLNANYPEFVGADGDASTDIKHSLPYTLVAVRVDVSRGIFYCELAN